MEGCPPDRYQEYFSKNKLPITGDLTYIIMFFQAFSCLI